MEQAGLAPSQIMPVRLATMFFDRGAYLIVAATHQPCHAGCRAGRGGDVTHPQRPEKTSEALLDVDAGEVTEDKGAGEGYRRQPLSPLHSAGHGKRGGDSLISGAGI